MKTKLYLGLIMVAWSTTALAQLNPSPFAKFFVNQATNPASSRKITQSLGTNDATALGLSGALTLTTNGDGTVTAAIAQTPGTLNIIPGNGLATVGDGTNVSNNRFVLYDVSTSKVQFQSAGISWLLGGNFGIGTNNPQQPLHVTGTVRATAFEDQNGNPITGGGGGGDVKTNANNTYTSNSTNNFAALTTFSNAVVVSGDTLFYGSNYLNSKLTVNNKLTANGTINWPGGVSNSIISTDGNKTFGPVFFGDGLNWANNILGFSGVITNLAAFSNSVIIAGTTRFPLLTPSTLYGGDGGANLISYAAGQNITFAGGLVGVTGIVDRATNANVADAATIASALTTGALINPTDGQSLSNITSLSLNVTNSHWTTPGDYIAVSDSNGKLTSQTPVSLVFVTPGFSVGTVGNTSYVTNTATNSAAGTNSLVNGTNVGDLAVWNGATWTPTPAGFYRVTGSTANATPTNLLTVAISNGAAITIDGTFLLHGRGTNSHSVTWVHQSGLFANDLSTITSLGSNTPSKYPATGWTTNWDGRYTISGTNVLIQGVGDTNGEQVDFVWQGNIITLIASSPVAFPQSPTIWLNSTNLPASGAITTWTDSSGNVHNFANGLVWDTSTRPTFIAGPNGQRAAYFDGVTTNTLICSNAYSLLNNAASATIISVINPSVTNSTGQAVFFATGAAGGNTARAALGELSTGGLSVYSRRLDADAIVSAPLTSVVISNWYILSADYIPSIGPTETGYTNGIAYGTASYAGTGNFQSTDSLSPNGVTIGSAGGVNQQFKGNIMEVMVFVPALSSTDRAYWNNYLKTKAGL